MCSISLSSMHVDTNLGTLSGSTVAVIGIAGFIGVVIFVETAMGFRHLTGVVRRSRRGKIISSASLHSSLNH